LLKRTSHSFLILLGVILLVFVLFQLLGDPAKMVAGQTGDKKTIEQIKHTLHLDEPKWKQFLYYLNDLSPVGIYDKTSFAEKDLNGFVLIENTQIIVLKWPYLGKSYQSKKPVNTILSEAFPATLVLALTAMLFAALTGIVIGVLAAMYKNSWIDRLSMVVSNVGISIPSFFMALIVAFLFGIYWNHYTGLHFTGSLFETDDWTGEKYLALKNIILPAFTLGIRPMAIITQLTRSAMLEVLQQDYIRTAYAMGIRKSKVIYSWALRNAMIPVFTSISGWFAELLAGAFFVEFIFGWKGLGKVTVDALGKLDFPLVMGAVLLSAFFYTLVQFVSDVLIEKLDPRINQKEV
jgi:peptide/nickel transport system permease protein